MTVRVCYDVLRMDSLDTLFLCSVGSLVLFLLFLNVLPKSSLLFIKNCSHKKICRFSNVSWRDDKKCEVFEISNMVK